MSKLTEFLESVCLIVIVLLLARGIHLLIGGFMTNWPLEVQIALSVAIAVVLLIIGVANAHNQNDKEGN